MNDYQTEIRRKQTEINVLESQIEEDKDILLRWKRELAELLAPIPEVIDQPYHLAYFLNREPLADELSCAPPDAPTADGRTVLMQLWLMQYDYLTDGFSYDVERISERVTKFVGRNQQAGTFAIIACIPKCKL